MSHLSPDTIPSSGARVTTGQWLGLIAAVHTLFGLGAGMFGLPEGPASGRSPMAEIWQLGVIGSIEPDLLRGLWFWFVWFGFAIFIAAFLMHKIERYQGFTDRTSLLMLGVLGLSGVLFLPASGFWFVVALAAIKLMRAPSLRRARPTLTST